MTGGLAWGRLASSTKACSLGPPSLGVIMALSFIQVNTFIWRTKVIGTYDEHGQREYRIREVSSPAHPSPLPKNEAVAFSEYVSWETTKHDLR